MGDDDIIEVGDSYSASIRVTEEDLRPESRAMEELFGIFAQIVGEQAQSQHVIMHSGTAAFIERMFYLEQAPHYIPGQQEFCFG